jgi:transcriptional regulator with XRE-family HTH domain
MVRALRQQQGLTLTVVARQSGLSKSFLSEIERNERRPTLSVLAAFAAALSVPVEDLELMAGDRLEAEAPELDAWAVDLFGWDNEEGGRFSAPPQPLEEGGIDG